MTVTIKGRDYLGSSFSHEIYKNETELDLSNGDLEKLDLEPLANCNNLRIIDLSENELRSIDLKPLSCCSKIEEINLKANEIKTIDLSPLAVCNNLKHLFLQKNLIKTIDLRPLKYCKKLEELSIDKKVECLWNDESLPSRNSLPVGLQKYYSRIDFVKPPVKEKPKPKVIEKRIIPKIADNIKFFYYIANKKHVKSILKLGILPRNTIKRLDLLEEDLSDNAIQNKRAKEIIKMSDGEFRQIHDLTNFYFTYDTASNHDMCKSSRDVVLFCISKKILNFTDHSFAFTDRHLLANNVHKFSSLSDLDKLDWAIINAKHPSYSKDENFRENKLKKMSEFYVFPKVEPQYIEKIIVPTYKIKSEIASYLKQLNRNINLTTNEDVFCDILASFYN